MHHMTQKEFEEIIRDHEIQTIEFKFNKIQPERSKREDHESGCGALNTVETQ